MRWEMRLGLERLERRRTQLGVVGRSALALRCFDGAAPVLRASPEHTCTRNFRLRF